MLSGLVALGMAAVIVAALLILAWGGLVMVFTHQVYRGR